MMTKCIEKIDEKIEKITDCLNRKTFLLGHTVQGCGGVGRMISLQRIVALCHFFQLSTIISSLHENQ